MKVRVVSSAEVFAAGRLSVATFLADHCMCKHGYGQHKGSTMPMRDQRRAVDKRAGKCTAPGCGCTEYQSQDEALQGPS